MADEDTTPPGNGHELLKLARELGIAFETATASIEALRDRATDETRKEELTAIMRLISQGGGAAEMLQEGIERAFGVHAMVAVTIHLLRGEAESLLKLVRRMSQADFARVLAGTPASAGDAELASQRVSLALSAALGGV